MKVYSKRRIGSIPIKRCDEESDYIIVEPCHIDVLHYRGLKLRLLCTPYGLEWFVEDLYLLQCFFLTQLYPAKLIAKLRLLSSPLKLKRYIDFGDGNKHCHTTIVHEVLWDCLATALSSDQLFEFYTWFTLSTKYIHIENARISQPDIVTYFCKPPKVQVGLRTAA